MDNRMRRKESGAALVIVLLLLTILSMLVADFLYRVRVNSYLTGNQVEQVRAKAVAQAGINASGGILLHSAPFNQNYRGNFQNQFIKLFQCRCYTASTLGELVGQELNPEAKLAQGEQEGKAEDELLWTPTECGEWSLVIQYPIGEDTLRLEIFDEQARLNLNGLVIQSQNPEEQGAQENSVFKPIVKSLFALRLRERGIEVDDKVLDEIMVALIDWLDYGQAGGSLDKDLQESYQDGDRIYFVKNGPMETVSELRMIPGVNEEFYYAVKDFLTVYPMTHNGKNFNFKVNFDLASLAVVYALVQGSSYQGDLPGMTEEEAMEMAGQMVQNGIDENEFLVPRQVLPELKGKLNISGSSFLLNAELPQPRYYHLVSSGITPSGVNYTIEAVVLVNPGKEELRFLYWREG